MKTLIISIALMSCFMGNCWALEGYATWYSAKSCQKEGNSGLTTASGEAFDETVLTCALRSRNYGHSYVVYSPNTGRSVVVKHNDYGPGLKQAKKGVIIDLTPEAFKRVCGDLGQGKCLVNVQEVIEDDEELTMGWIQ